jgi:hypothetical protein
MARTRLHATVTGLPIRLPAGADGLRVPDRRLLFDGLRLHRSHADVSAVGGDGVRAGARHARVDRGAERAIARVDPEPADPHVVAGCRQVASLRRAAIDGAPVRGSVRGDDRLSRLARLGSGPGGLLGCGAPSGDVSRGRASCCRCHARAGRWVRMRRRTAIRPDAAWMGCVRAASAGACGRRRARGHAPDQPEALARPHGRRRRGIDRARLFRDGDRDLSARGGLADRGPPRGPGAACRRCPRRGLGRCSHCGRGARRCRGASGVVAGVRPHRGKGVHPPSPHVGDHRAPARGHRDRFLLERRRGGGADRHSFPRAAGARSAAISDGALKRPDRAARARSEARHPDRGSSARGRRSPYPDELGRRLHARGNSPARRPTRADRVLRYPSRLRSTASARPAPAGSACCHPCCRRATSRSPATDSRSWKN